MQSLCSILSGRRSPARSGSSSQSQSCWPALCGLPSPLAPSSSSHSLSSRSSKEFTAGHLTNVATYRQRWSLARSLAGWCHSTARSCTCSRQNATKNAPAHPYLKLASTSPSPRRSRFPLIWQLPPSLSLLLPSALLPPFASSPLLSLLRLRQPAPQSAVLLL